MFYNKNPLDSHEQRGYVEIYNFNELLNAVATA